LQRCLKPVAIGVTGIVAKMQVSGYKYGHFVSAGNALIAARNAQAFSRVSS
jgi:hypothetical protein